MTPHQSAIRNARLDIVESTARWHEESIAFATLGDLVYMLLVASWSYPDLDPQTDIDALLALEDALRTPEGIVVTEHRHLIRAHKPS